MGHIGGTKEYKFEDIYCLRDSALSKGLLDAFSEKYNEAIYENDPSSEEIRNERIAYFKLRGVDLGDDYSLYEKSPEAKKIWPTQELINKNEELRKKYNKEWKEEFFIQTSNYEENIKRILELEVFNRRKN